MSAGESFLTNFIEKRLAEPAEAGTHAHLGGRSLARGLLAGLLGGLAATAAKSVAEKIYPPRTHGEPEPPDVLIDKVAGHHVTGTTKTVATEAVHWGFGALSGAAYGALVEFYPAAAARHGANFGMTLVALTHEGALPALGLSADPADQTMREKSSEVVTHVLFGLVCEGVRRYVRNVLEEPEAAA